MIESKMNLAHQTLFYSSVVVFFVTLFVSPLTALFGMIYAMVISTLVVSSYYHRYLAHKSWNCPRWLEVVLLTLGAGHGFMPGFSWVNIHFKHHRFADTEKDPHGPHLSLFKNLNLAMHTIDVRYVTRRLYNDSLVMFQVNHYWKILIVCFLVWSCLFGPLSWFAINAYSFINLVAVNMIAHRKGKGPINIPALALFVSGETYHKNHHDNPNEAKFGTMDPGWWWIKVFQRA